MLDKILKLYTTSMATDTRSPLVHLFGPPGCGKSSSVQQAADLIGVRMHTINLSRVSPLELEGVQMPHGTAEDMKLKLLHATFWTQINEGDIVLFDEFLRAFNEVYNGLLDILTAREVGGFKLPRAFFIAASNSVVTYDKALEDRLLHLPVVDARRSKPEREHIASMIVDEIGLLPSSAKGMEMDALIDNEVLPLYAMMDHLTKRTSPPVLEGRSPRNIIGQAKLRQVESRYVRDLIDVNNINVASSGKWQYLFLLDGKNPPSRYVYIARNMLAGDKLTPLQRINTQLNLELIEYEEARSTRPDTTDEEEVIA